MRFNLELMGCYKNVPLRYKLYTIIRCAICPFVEIERYVPNEGKILDFGCGHGIFANFLIIKSKRRYVIGIDIMENKIKVAKSSLGEKKNIEFRVGDAKKNSYNLKDIKCITLIDILCYIPFEKNKKLLKRFYDCLQDGGVLLIKTMQGVPRWKYWWMLFHMATIDKFVHQDFIKNSYIPQKKEYIDLLEDIGFKVEFKDINRGYPYPHCLYICNKVNLAAKILNLVKWQG